MSAFSFTPLTSEGFSSAPFTTVGLHIPRPTLNKISVVMVKPWVMMGSSSGGFPFQQSNSTQRQPDSSTWRYISAEERPENWPAERAEKRRGEDVTPSQASPLTTSQSVPRASGVSGSGTASVENPEPRTHLSGRCCGRS